jgi:arginyl-tRNA synthetase
MTIRALLSERVHQAMIAAGIPEDCEPLVAPSKKVGFGDYQANCAMGAAKKMGVNPRELAQKIVDHLNLEQVATKIEIAGPGFINIHLAPQWLATELMSKPPYHSLAQSTAQQTIVVDYSGPNLAKEMHVGHLRSTIIGDAVVHVLESLGHTVIRQNHVGDWGTQFGMLIAELEAQVKEGEQPELALHDLERFYQQAKTHFDADPAFANLARDYVVKLQSGDAHIKALWQQFRDVSLAHSEEIYHLLNVSLTPDDVRGESFYNADLSVLVEELKQKNLAVENEGALVVFLPELADKKNNPSPVIVQKKDGGYLYATSDLAAIRFRVNTLKADRIMVFSDARQALHMQQVYITAKKAGFAPAHTQLEHHPFGTMMGADGKPFKTRTGGTIKLAELLREAVERAEAAIKDSNELSVEEKKIVARKVGIGAVKYADLSKTRTLDYVFDWDLMLSFDGNTGPYLQYAYTRIRSIFRKANIDPNQLAGAIVLNEPQERALALTLLQFSETVEQVGKEALPHLLCNYLYELASLFMSFYEACPILKDGIAPEVKTSRLLLSDLVANTVEKGLRLLGIEVMEKM